MVSQKRKNSENIAQAGAKTNKYQLVELKSSSGFCNWKAVKTQFEEEQLQNSIHTEIIRNAFLKSISGTEEEQQLCAQNLKIVFFKEELDKCIEIDDDDVKNLCDISSGNTGNHPDDKFIVSHVTKLYESKFKVKIFTGNGKCFDMYKLTFRGNTINNVTNKPAKLYVFRSIHGFAFWHDDIDKYRNIIPPLYPYNINVLSWVHRIRFSKYLAEDPVIQQFYPGYCQKKFFVLFCQFIITSDTKLKERMSITKYDLLTVYLEKSWLNDQVINKYFDLIKARNNATENNNIYVFDTFFFSQFLRHSYNHVQNYTKKIDIFSFKKLMIPINTGNHWVLICYDALLKKLIYFDSIMNQIQTRMAFFASKVIEYFKLEHKAKKGVEFNEDGLHCINGRSPVQTNSYDCGVFTCINGELFSRDKQPFNSYSQTHISVCRHKITFELLNKQLMTQ